MNTEELKKEYESYCEAKSTNGYIYGWHASNVWDFLAEKKRAMPIEDIHPSAVLISALLNGHQLVKKHETGDVETLWCEYGKDGNNYFYIHGWGSALGQSKDRVFDVIDKPEQWSIELQNVQVSDTTEDER